MSEPMTDAELAFLRGHVEKFGADIAADYVRSLIARLDRAEAAGAWREMTDAPTDGTEIWLSGFKFDIPPDRWVGHGAWRETGPHGAGWYDHDGEEATRYHPPTHWRPLPSPPPAGQGEG